MFDPSRPLRLRLAHRTGSPTASSHSLITLARASLHVPVIPRYPTTIGVP
jgi:hypothetical protein